MHSHLVSEFNSDKRENIKLGNQVVQSGYSIFLFTILSRNDWLKAVENAVGVYTYLGTLAGLTLVKAGIFLYDLLVSKNKNLGKVASFLRELFAATILTLAVLGGFGISCTLGALMPIFFVASTAVGALYNIGTALYNAYHFMTEKDIVLREKYKESLIKYTKAAVISTIGTVAISLLMLTSVAHVAMTVLNACYNAFCFSLGVYKAIKIYQQKIKDEILMLESLTMREEEENKPLQNKPVIKDEPKNDASLNYSTSQIEIEMDRLGTNIKPFEKIKESKHLVSKNNIKNDYFFNKKRESMMFKQSDARFFIFNEVRSKINSLRDANESDALNHRLFSQGRKRLLKIECLEKLKDLIRNDTKTIDDFYDLLKEPMFNSFFSNPFQSFFRQKSDTQDIFECAEKYFQHLKLVKDKKAQDDANDVKENSAKKIV